MQHLDEGTIHTWLDGALDADDARRIEAHLAECPSCTSAVAGARGLIAASSRILSALDAVPANVIPAAPASPPAHAAAVQPDRGAQASHKHADGEPVRGTRSRWLPRAARIAAVVTFVAIGATMATRIMGDRTVRSARPAPRNEADRPMASDLATRSGLRAPQMRSADSAVARSTPPAPRAPGKSTAQRRPPSAAKIAAALPSSSEHARSAPASSDSLDEERPSASNALAGAAPAAAKLPLGRQLRLVAADRVVTPDARVVQRRIYEVRPGVRVTLEESTAPAAQLAPTETRARVRAFAPTAAPALDMQSKRAAAADSIGLNSIRWTDSTGTRFTLTGRLTIEELRRLKGVVH